MAEPLWSGWLGLRGPGLALLRLSTAQIGMGYSFKRHTIASSAGEDVAGKMWSAGSHAWLSAHSEMRSRLHLQGDSVARCAWPVGEVAVRRRSSSTAGQAIVNMGFLWVDQGRPRFGLHASSSQTPGNWGSHHPGPLPLLVLGELSGSPAPSLGLCDCRNAFPP